MHGAFSIPRKTLGLRPTDQSCHHETWLHLDFVDWSNTWSKQGERDRHISLKERPDDTSQLNSVAGMLHGSVPFIPSSLCISPITNTMSRGKKGKLLKRGSGVRGVLLITKQHFNLNDD